MDNGGRGVSAGCMRIRCSSPRRIMARWFSSQEKVKGKTAVAESGRRDGDVTKIRCSEGGRRIADPLDWVMERTDSELPRRDFVFNVGVSCLLLHLVAAGREELHKMAGLRAELEKFLESFKEEPPIKNRGFLSEPPEQSGVYAYSTTDVQEGPDSSSHPFSPQISATSMNTVQEGYLQHYPCHREEDLGGGMDRLEAELAAELELLQTRLDPEHMHSSIHPNQEYLEDADKIIGESDGFGFRPTGVGEEKSFIDEHEHGLKGVSPYDLERRLHELVETRHEEQIKELEAALELAKQKLHLKETEVSWWKDTAYLVSERIPEPSRISSNLKGISGTHPLSR
ncbi:PREDICTED: protein POLAR LOCALIZATION DURING ASYMMETRIC DIVISION AND REDISTRIBUTION [Tarenaya hassleriana]|uniref:protein POLAR LOCALIZATION DURING ASYMMETRIC DIVISION AND REDISTRIBUTION n=1 Tax=Tarenaya hassleriana TaxID=28532 RepID=UPI00053C8279|nr:PREDICTED: protein POLAR LOCALIZATION DURING ASYMMETRIC DIVISION AND REDISTRIBUTION [Tarenaya hassleriana]